MLLLWLRPQNFLIELFHGFNVHLKVTNKTSRNVKKGRKKKSQRIEGLASPGAYAYPHIGKVITGPLLSFPLHFLQSNPLTKLLVLFFSEKRMKEQRQSLCKLNMKNQQQSLCNHITRTTIVPN